MKNNIENRKIKFYNKVYEKFQFKFDLSKVDFVRVNSCITVICPFHEEFTTTPDVFVRSKYGCSKCADVEVGIQQKKTAFDKFLQDSPKIHNNKYDYSLVKYIDSHTRVTVVCPQHGSFTVTPTSHMNMKAGCQTCCKYNQTVYSESYFRKRPHLKTIDGKCYAIKMSIANEQFIKIGITKSNKSFSSRLRKYKASGIAINEYIIFESCLYDCFLLERKLLKQFAKYQHIPSLKFHGWTECVSSECWSVIRQEFNCTQ
tara:strand:+ start:2587 stop:3360 length:774 start_codon:yes stop_codon:yes gene_type:complete